MSSPRRVFGLNFNGRSLAIVLVVLGVVGAMAFYRGHTTPEEVWDGLTHSDEAPLASNQVSALIQQDKEQELLAQRVKPAVVMVNVTSKGSPEEMGMGRGGGGLPPDNPLSQFFGQFPHRPQFEQGLGSGIIISPDGYIVTNNHVVTGSTEIRVTLSDNREFPAKIVGTDALTDLAVIKIAASGLPNLPWGDSRTLQQGDNVYAFGNPFQFNFTMTHGIVSGKGRINLNRTDARAPGDYIQTDAAINPGNSGGPLVNSRGEVVGVNAFIYTSTGSFNGEAFAIPSEIAQPITATLIAKGKVVRGYLGINIVAMSPELAPFFKVNPSATGALVTSVNAGEPGAQAGLRAGDLIVSFNGKKVDDPTQLQLDTAAVPPGSTVKLGIIRDTQHQTVAVRLGRAPEETASNKPAPKANESTTGVQLGIGIQDLTPQDIAKNQFPPDTKGVMVASVTPGGPAYNADIIPGMVIADIDRHPVTNTQQVHAELDKIQPGQPVLLRVLIPGPQGGGTYIVVHPTARAATPGGGGGGE